MEKELCQICHHRIAEHKFVRIVDGAERAYRICSHCKAMMDNKYRELKAEAARKAIPPENRVCGVCGCTLENFLSTGLLGCENCYRVFDDYLAEYIRGYQGATTHVGMDARPVSVDVEDLYRELAELSEKQEYEKAAKVKRKIDAMLGKNND